MCFLDGVVLKYAKGRRNHAMFGQPLVDHRLEVGRGQAFCVGVADGGVESLRTVGEVVVAVAAGCAVCATAVGSDCVRGCGGGVTAATAAGVRGV